MDRKILTALIIPIVLLFSSCAKDANIPVPKDVPKLVVYSYITPGDTLVRVKVSHSIPVFNNPYNESDLSVGDATVTMTTLGTTYTLSSSGYGYYTLPTSTMAVNPGQTYVLNVSASGFTAVSASTRVPDANNFQFQVTEVSTSAPSGGSFQQPRMYKYDIRFNHFNDADYYRLASSFYHVDSVGFPGQDTVVNNSFDTFYDKTFANGGVVTDQVDAFTEIYEEPYAFANGFYFDLIVSGYDYFKFHQSLQNYSYGDPFSEPSLIYTNMTNGYGIFAGYLRIRLRDDN
jgi:hypothetical protein